MINNVLKMIERPTAVDPLDLSKDYYFFIKDAFKDYSKYIKEFKIISTNYIKKLIQLQEKFGLPLFDLDKIKSKYKNLKINEIYNLIALVPKVIQKFINSYNSSVNRIDKIIENLDKILLEKINIEQKEEDELKFDLIKNNLNKGYRNIDKNKIAFMNKMSTTEDNIFKFFTYMSKNNNQYLPEDKNKKEKEKEKEKDIILKFIKEKVNNDNLITKEVVSLNLEEAKKAETLYLSSFDSVADLEKSFNNISQKYKHNLSKTSLDLTNELKQIILDTTTNLKACFSDPLNEIVMMLEKLHEIEKNNNIQKIINDFFKIDKNITNQKPKLYKIKILSEPQQLEGKRNPKYPKIILEDGCDKMEYFENYSTLDTINTLYSNFKLIEKDKNFDHKKEASKLKTKEISQKLLSYSNKEKSQITDEGNISLTKEEINKLKDLLNDHANRVIFLQDLNTFRAKGLYGLPKDIYDFFKELFIIMCNTIARDKDYHTAKNLIILSQTYYYLEDEIKRYLQECIQNHEIFQNFKFWEGYMQFSIEKEIIKSIQIDTKNGTLIKRTKEESDDLYGTVVFAQLISVADNMMNFNFDTKNIKAIVKPIIKHYNIKEESIKIIDDILYKNKFRQSMLLNDEIKLIDVNKLYDYYKNFDVFGNTSIINTTENPDDEINKAEKLEDIFDNKNDEEKGE